MESTLQNLKVLILEDSEIDIEIVYQKLIDNFICPITFDKAQNEECFLHLIKNNQYDVILADYTLPGYNAVSALEQSQKICPDTPFICVSGTIGEDRAVEMLKQGAADYVLKDRLQRLPFAIRRAIKTTLLDQDRKKAEQAFKELNQNNQLILDSTNDGIAMLDRDGNILNINEKFARRLGKTFEDVIGLNFKTFLPEEIFGEMYQQRLKRLRKAFDSGQPEIFEDSRNGIHFYNRFYPVFKDGNVTSVTLFSTDITDRVKMEEEASRNAVLRIEAEMYRKKEEEYLEILDGSTEASWIYDFKNKTLEFSKEWLMRIGGENIPSKDMDTYIKSLVHPDDVQRSIEERMQIQERKLPKFKVEYRLKTINGYIWVYDQGKIIYNENGTPEKIYGTTMDITEKKQSEEALRESETMLRTVLENSRDGITMLDLKTGIYVYMNPAQYEIAGYKPEEISSVSAEAGFAHLHPDDREISVNQQKETVNGTAGYEDSEYRWKVKSGEYRWLSDRRKLVRNEQGDPVYLVGINRDITESKKAEEALRESEALFRAVQENSLDRFTILRPFYNDQGEIVDFTYVYQNTQAAETTRRKPEELVGRRMTEIFPTFPQTRFFAIYKQVVETGQAQEFEDRYNADGLDEWFRATVTPLLDGIAVATQIITERKRLTDEIKNSQLLLNTIVQNTRDLLFLNDSEGRVVFVNDAYIKTFGIELKDVVGKNALELYHDEEVARKIEENDRKVMQTGEAIVSEEIAQTPDGKLSTFLTTKSPWRDGDGKIVGVVGVSHNITERKQAEAQLIRSEREFRTLAENAPDVIMRFDKNLRILYLNPQVEAATGIRVTQYIGKTNEEMGMPEHLCHMWNNLFRSAYELKTVQETEFNYSGPEGTKTYRLRVAPELADDGSVQTFLGISTDISRHKRAEDALRESEQKALALVAELEKADKNKNDFIGVMSHELRNPLAVIVAGLSLLEVTDSQELITSAKKIIGSQVGQLCRLVDDLLDLTRIDQNKVKLKKETVNLNELLKNASRDMMPKYRVKGIRLNTELPPEPVYLSADLVRIAQCAGNLLENALKFTPNKGHVALSLKQENGEAVISVRDNGMGIGTDLLEHVFEPFVQADTSLDRTDGDGLGLGLSIVKSIVELHGGSVSAFSKGVGKGARFTIRLPITGQTAEPQTSAAEKKPSRRLRILIIEDNMNLADILRSMLSRIGHEAHSAYSGLIGFSEAKSLRPDVIFCDIGLPGLSGYDVAEVLKADDELKNTFLIALTGYAGEGDIDRARAAGFDQHLAKPVDMAMLENILSKIP
jgi:PAS domain S-box-containing protein